MILQNRWDQQPLFCFQCLWEVMVVEQESVDLLLEDGVYIEEYCWEAAHGNSYAQKRLVRRRPDENEDDGTPRYEGSQR